MADCVLVHPCLCAHFDDPDGQILPAMAWPAAMAYARCFGQCTALDTLAEAVAYGQECVNGVGILKNCAVECLNPLNYLGAGKILKAARSQRKGEPFLPDQYYADKLNRKAPGQAAPYARHERFDAAGNLKQVTTYDQYGDRIRQYDVGPRARHGEGVHRYEYDAAHPRHAPGGGRRTPQEPL